MESLGAEINLVAFRTVCEQQLWELDADGLQVACLPRCSSGWVCTPSPGCSLHCWGHGYQGDIRAGRSMRAGKTGADGGPWDSKAGSRSWARPTISPALGITHLTGDRDRLRPGWDISLRISPMARQGFGRAGAWHSDGVSGAPRPWMG